MKVTPIVRQLRTYCPFFENRVAAAMEFDAARDEALLPAPAAYVVPTQDDADENQTQNTIRQWITDQFDVVVVIATQDARGQSRIDLLHDVRALLWKALVGFAPLPDWSAIDYEGGSLLMLNRERVLYRFGFAMQYLLGAALEPETWHAYALDDLTPLEGFQINVDAIEPMADKNRCYPGPDGRIELIVKEDFGR